MRLIDADELPEVNTIERIEGDREVFVNSWIPASAIWEAPTVEAIPVNWIVDWLTKQHVPATHTCDDYYAVEMMLEDWEKENGLDK